MGDLETKVLSGLAVVILSAGGGLIVRRVRLWSRYHHLAGAFGVTRKVTNEPTGEQVSITVKGNVLAVVYDNLPEGESVNGEIRMTGRTGDGEYTHIKGNMTLWGRWTVQLDPPDEILVERTYTSHKTPEKIVTPFVWRRIGSGGDPNARR